MADTCRTGRSAHEAPRRPSKAATPVSGPAPTLRILETRVLRGPNYWAREPVIRLLVDLGVLEEYPSNMLPNFTDALVALMPTLEDHACSLGRRGGFITRLREGTWVGHIAEHVALEFQNLAGTDVRHGKTRSAGAYGPVQLHLRIPRGGGRARGRPDGRRRWSTTSSRRTTRRSSSTSRRSSSALIRMAERQAFGPSTQALIDEAVSRDIPFIRLDRHSLVQFGHGVHQQRIRATMTSQTSAIGVDIASDKSLTNRLLDSAGLPVPRADVVDTEEEPSRPPKRLGYPCVVKPLDGNHGRGVHLDLRSEEASARRSTAPWRRAAAATSSSRPMWPATTTAAWSSAARSRPSPSACRHRSPATASTPFAQLVEHRQRRPAPRHRAREGADPDQARRRGRGARRGRRASSSTRPARGHLGQARPDRQHVDRRHVDRPHHRGAPRQRRDRRDGGPDRRARRRRHRLHLPGHRDAGPRDRAARSSRSTPRPASGCTPTRPRASRSTWPGPVIDSLFPAGSSARIPIMAVTGTNGKTTTVRMIAHILKLMGRRVGMTSTDGIVVDGRLIKKGDMSGPKSAQMVLQNPTVDTAVFEVARGGILREGLGYDRNDVAVVTNVTGDHLGLGGINSIGQLANVKGVVVEAVPRSGHGGPQRRRQPRLPDGPPLRGPGRAVQHGHGEGRGRLRPRRRPHRRGAGRRSASSLRGGRAHRPAPRAADDARPLHAPHPRDLRRAGPDERRQRACRGRRRVGRRARTSTTSARACGPSRPRSSRRRAGSTCSTSAGSGS